MKVILLQDVAGAGKKGEVKEVKDGYARNFLIPNRKAEFASPAAIQRVEVKKKSEEAEKEIQKALAQKALEMLKDVKVVLDKRANEKGHLFEQVHLQEISTAIKDQAKLDIAPEFIKIEKPIKEIGGHKISVEIGKNKGEFILHLQSS